MDMESIFVIAGVICAGLLLRGILKICNELFDWDK